MSTETLFTVAVASSGICIDFKAFYVIRTIKIDIL